MSRNADWILQCLGIYQGGDYLDEIEDNFGIKTNLNPYSTLFLVKWGMPEVGNKIAQHLYFAIMDKAITQLKAKAKDFEYVCNGTQDTHLFYKGQEVSCWEDIVELSKQND